MTQIIFKPENVDGFDGFYWDKDDFGAWWGPLNDWDVSHRDFVESIKNRRTVIQAGGNLGLYVCFLSKRFENVITFEPDPDNFAILVKNVEYHGLKNVIAINSALGEETRSAKMRKGPRENVGMHQIDESGDIPVEMIALNDLTTVANLDFLWLDIEQYELPALRGAAASEFNKLMASYPGKLKNSNHSNIRYAEATGSSSGYIFSTMDETMYPWIKDTGRVYVFKTLKEAQTHEAVIRKFVRTLVKAKVEPITTEDFGPVLVNEILTAVSSIHSQVASISPMKNSSSAKSTAMSQINKLKEKIRNAIEP
ncbi:methyltransferase [Sinorhizobium phage phiM19]|nr:methyltransferase [Sinorhizobium phage phiM19]